MLNVTCALIIKNGKLLITRNGSNSDHALQWEFPGGKIDKDETQEACIVREIMEELELTIRIETPLVPIEHNYGTKEIRLIPFICSVNGGKLKLNNHIAEKWIDLEELKNIDFSEADKRLIENETNLQGLKEYTRKQKN